MLLLLKLAFRNIQRHPGKSLLLGSLITIGIAILFLANSIFLGTTDGLKTTFIGSFTGHAAIASKSETTFSLFGNEIPIVSDLEIIPPLLEQSAVVSKLDKIPGINSFTSIVSVPARLTIGKYNENVVLFGIDPETYFQVCQDIVLLKGNPEDLSDKGVFINEALAQDLEKNLKRELRIGEIISFSLYSGNSFKIRSAPLMGIHRYAGSTEALDKVVLSDLVTARSLAGYTLGFSTDKQNSGLNGDEAENFNLDDLFSTDSDVTYLTDSQFELQDFEEEFSDTEERDALSMTDNGAWSFILIRAVEGKSREMISRLKGELKKSGIDADILSWRMAAGSTAMILFAIQSVFYLGLGFLGIGAVLVIMNALVFSVLERGGEIGTMRSLGAEPRFIRTLFMLESLIITMGGAFMGILLGSLLVKAVIFINPELTNPLLVSLFGGNSIHPLITPGSIFSHMFTALVIGCLAWIYPVSLAMKIQPITAMNKG